MRPLNPALLLLLLRNAAARVSRGVRWVVRHLPRWPRLPPPWLPPFRRRLLTNLVLGLGIALALHQVQHSAYLTQVEAQALDWVMGLYRGGVPPGNPRPLAFIEIDEASHRAWGEPLATPRAARALLIDHGGYLRGYLRDRPRFLHQK